VSGEPLLCNIWPYWYSSASFGNGAGCRGDQYLFPPSVAGAQYPSGMWVTNVQGWRHNFWSTTELRRHFVHTGAPFGIEFVGDDDLFIFINGVLVVDLGGTHQRLPGRIDVTSDVTAGGIASIVEGGAVDPATDSTLNCPSADPYTQLFANSTTNSDGNGHLNCTSANCDCRRRMLGLGLQMGRSYEIAIFHADRHPPHSNYQLTMRLPSAPRTTCQPVCGNGTVTIDEQCDAGTSNNDATYGGCTTACRLGPHCGDGVKNGPEDCDLGLTNGAAYGNRNGCSRACKYVRFCGDSVVDLADGEQCDFGSNNGASGTPCDSTCRLLTP
jgi:fibro-slime domain-containing protein